MAFNKEAPDYNNWKKASDARMSYQKKWLATRDTDPAKAETYKNLYLKAKELQNQYAANVRAYDPVKGTGTPEKIDTLGDANAADNTNQNILDNTNGGTSELAKTKIRDYYKTKYEEDKKKQEAQLAQQQKDKEDITYLNSAADSTVNSVFNSTTDSTTDSTADIKKEEPIYSETTLSSATADDLQKKIDDLLNNTEWEDDSTKTAVSDYLNVIKGRLSEEGAELDKYNDILKKLADELHGKWDGKYNKQLEDLYAKQKELNDYYYQIEDNAKTYYDTMTGVLSRTAGRQAGLMQAQMATKGLNAAYVQNSLGKYEDAFLAKQASLEKTYNDALSDVATNLKTIYDDSQKVEGGIFELQKGIDDDLYGVYKGIEDSVNEFNNKKITEIYTPFETIVKGKMEGASEVEIAQAKKTAALNIYKNADLDKRYKILFDYLGVLKTNGADTGAITEKILKEAATYDNLALALSFISGKLGSATANAASKSISDYFDDNTDNESQPADTGSIGKDSDGDGTPDLEDDFPEDPTKSKDEDTIIEENKNRDTGRDYTAETPQEIIDGFYEYKNIRGTKIEDTLDNFFEAYTVETKGNASLVKEFYNVLNQYVGGNYTTDELESNINSIFNSYINKGLFVKKVGDTESNNTAFDLYSIPGAQRQKMLDEMNKVLNAYYNQVGIEQSTRLIGFDLNPFDTDTIYSKSNVEGMMKMLEEEIVKWEKDYPGISDYVSNRFKQAYAHVAQKKENLITSIANSTPLNYSQASDFVDYRIQNSPNHIIKNANKPDTYIKMINDRFNEGMLPSEIIEYTEDSFIKF